MLKSIVVVYFNGHVGIWWISSIIDKAIDETFV